MTKATFIDLSQIIFRRNVTPEWIAKAKEIPQGKAIKMPDNVKANTAIAQLSKKHKAKEMLDIKIRKAKDGYYICNIPAVK